jgi:hypothetical protein
LSGKPIAATSASAPSIARRRAPLHCRLAEQEVLLDGELGHDGRLLVRDHHALGQRLAWRVLAAPDAVHAHRAAVRSEGPAEDAEQGALARAVLPRQREDLTVPECEAHVVERTHPRERLRDVADLKKGCSHRWMSLLVSGGGPAHGIPAV